MKYVNQALQKIQREIDGNVVVMANLFLVLMMEQTKKIGLWKAVFNSLHIKSHLGTPLEKHFYFKHMQNRLVWWTHMTHIQLQHSTIHDQQIPHPLSPFSYWSKFQKSYHLFYKYFLWWIALKKRTAFKGHNCNTIIIFKVNSLIQ